MSIESEQMWKCKPCSKTFKSMHQLDQHKSSKNHKKSVKQYQQEGKDVSESSLFQSFSKSQFINVSPSKQDSVVQLEEDSAEQIQEVRIRKTTLDSLRVCLFCDQENQGVKMNLDHMRIKHGFFLLDIDCVTNIKGLIEYIAERVQLGHLCLFCSKQFADPIRC